MTTQAFSGSFTKEIPARIVVNIQSLFRVLILIGLFLVVRNKRIGIVLMWLGIGMLVVSQFWLVSISDSEQVYAMFSGIKPLKGLILPTLITGFYFKKRTTK